MSYSRFSNSVWYTYWHVASGNAMDQQYLAVHHVNDKKRFPFYVYGSGMETYVEMCEKQLAEQGYELTEDEKIELKGYMILFEDDVENEFL